jgi:uncharacterized protein (DUF1697 family)
MMKSYVAFLRGINSGRNPPVRMEFLRKIFEDLGFGNVRTVLASGNVLFETDLSDEKALEQQIEKILPAKIGFLSHVLIRKMDDIRQLVASQPFGHIPPDLQKRYYITFVQDKPETSPDFPVNGTGFTILGMVDGVVCSVVDLKDAKTPDLMQVLDREFGKGNTTRNWNTLKKIVGVSTGR